MTRLRPLLTIALLAAPIGAAPARTVVAPAAMQDTSRLIRAANDLTQRLTALTARNAPVSELRKREMVALLRDTFDLTTVRGLPRDTTLVLPALLSLTAAYQALYQFATTGPNPGPRALSVQNILIDATIVVDLCAKRSFAATNRAFGTLRPDQITQRHLDGVRRMQEGYRSALHGMLTMQSDPGVSAANRARLIDGLFEDADVVVAALPPRMRAMVAVDIRKFAAQAGATTKARLNQLARLFDSTDCTGLCSVRVPS